MSKVTMNKFIVTVSSLLLASCSLAPDLVMPDTKTPAAFKEAPKSDEKITDGAWAPAHPNAVAGGAWWSVFNDKQLDDLINEAKAQSPTLEAAKERLAQARARSGIADSALLPRLDVGAGPTVGQPSAASLGLPHGSMPKTTYTYTASGTISYEADLFGKNRANSNAAELSAASAEATYQAAMLSLEADVAQAYYTLRSLDREQEILNTTQKLREETRDLTKRSLKIGDVSELDVTRAESELAQTKAEALDVGKRRAEAEHNLALLLGKPPANLNMAKNAISGIPPTVPAGVPSELLERRPDIQAAQKQMAAANEGIGVARAAFFPVLNLTASGGFQSNQLSQLFDWSSRTWLLGPLAGTMLTAPIFDAGQNISNLALSKAEFREAVANYRQSVLVAFKEVEDQLSGLRYLKGEAEAQAEGVRAARKAFSIAKTRYENGYISYLEFIDAQRSLLAAERGEVQVLGGRYITTVQLIRALGGSWSTAGMTTAGEAPAVKPVAAPQPVTMPTPTAKPVVDSAKPAKKRRR